MGHHGAVNAGRARRNLGFVSLAAVMVLGLSFAIVAALDAAPRSEATALAVTASGPHRHVAGFAREEPITDAAIRRTLQRQLAYARESVGGIRTTTDAAAHGYLPVTLDLAYLGVHYLKPALLEPPFSPRRPTHLIFDREGPEGRLIGLMYYVETDGDAPAGFAGPNDHWHVHETACMSNGIMLALDDVTDTASARLGGALVPLPRNFANRWMLHVWVVPGNTNPWGTFADGNPALA